jgi:CRISPR-associated protein Cas2
VCYDVRDEARLRQVARLLEGYGERVQYSVFRCRLTPRELERLRWELGKVVAQEDAWLMVPLCEDCVGRLRSQHGERWWPAEPPGYVIV